MLRQVRDADGADYRGEFNHGIPWKHLVPPPGTCAGTTGIVDCSAAAPDLPRSTSARASAKPALAATAPGCPCAKKSHAGTASTSQRASRIVACTVDGRARTSAIVGAGCFPVPRKPGGSDLVPRVRRPRVCPCSCCSFKGSRDADQDLRAGQAADQQARKPTRSLGGGYYYS